MLPKKNTCANLEKKRAVHIQLGLIIALSFVLVSLEWGTHEAETKDAILFVTDVEPVLEEIDRTIREETEEKKIPQLLIPIPVDESELEDLTDFSELFNSEDRGDGYGFSFPEEEEEARIIEPIDKALVQIKPEFPGGEEEMMKWLYRNLKYPQTCIEHDIEGKVTAKFTISKFGKVTDVRIVRKVHPKLDAEVIRVLNEMPNFRPAMQNGILVPVFMHIPVVFDLQ